MGVTRTPVIHLIQELQTRDIEAADALSTVMQERDNALREADKLRHELSRARGAIAVFSGQVTATPAYGSTRAPLPAGSGGRARQDGVGR